MDKREMLAEAIAEAKQIKEVAYSQAKLTMEENLMPHLQSMLSKRIQEMESEDDQVEENFIPEEEINEAENEGNDLDELLREIENDAEETPEPEQEEGTEDETPEDEDDEELNIEDMSEEDLKGFIEDVINDMIETGELEPGEEHEEPEEGEEEIDVDTIEGDEVPEKEEEIKEDLEEESVEDENDYLSEINSFRTQLNEMKVFNAKLLYTNKIFLSKTLTEGKKLQVVHAFEKANTVKEAKMIYETLKDNLGDKKIVRESFKGAASKTIIPIKESRQPIIEANDQYNRWQVLAGIKPNN